VTGLKIAFHASLLISERAAFSICIAMRGKFHWETARIILKYIRKFACVFNTYGGEERCMQGFSGEA
jgi:hypothetical protein